MGFGKGHVDHDGPYSARLAIVGEAPGKTELEKGFPMAGWTGDFVNAALGPGARGKTFIVNASRCMPPEYESKETFHDRLANYSDALAQDFSKLVEARTLLLVGSEALRAVLGLPSISVYHGSVFTRAEAEGCRAAARPARHMVRNLPPRVHSIVCSYHPAFTTRGLPQFKPLIRTAIGRAQNWAYSSDGPQRPDYTEFNLDPTPTELQAFVTEHEQLTIDVETPYDNHSFIKICGVYADGKALVFPWVAPFIGIMRRVLESPDKVKCGHNFAFDMRAFAAYGINTVFPVVDTIDMGALLWPMFKQKDKGEAGSKKKVQGAKWLSLYMCASRVLRDVVNWKEPSTPATQAIYSASYPWCPDWQRERLYCALDCRETDRTRWAMRSLLQKEGML